MKSVSDILAAIGLGLILWAPQVLGSPKNRAHPTALCSSLLSVVIQSSLQTNYSRQELLQAQVNPDQKAEMLKGTQRSVLRSLYQISITKADANRLRKDVNFVAHYGSPDSLELLYLGYLSFKNQRGFKNTLANLFFEAMALILKRHSVHRKISIREDGRYLVQTQVFKYEHELEEFLSSHPDIAELFFEYGLTTP